MIKAPEAAAPQIAKEAVRCDSCGDPVPDDATSCPRCGAPVISRHTFSGQALVPEMTAGYYTPPPSAAARSQRGRRFSGPAFNPSDFAPWSVRVLAWAVDFVAVTVVAFGLGLLVVLTGSPQAKHIAQGLGYLLNLVFLIMQAYTGATPGKYALGIRVVDWAGRPLGCASTFAREFFHIVDGFFFFGYLRPLWHDKKQTFADTIVGSTVVRA